MNRNGLAVAMLQLLTFLQLIATASQTRPKCSAARLQRAACTTSLTRSACRSRV